MGSKSYRPVTGFFLSLSGGILILFGGIAMLAVKALMMAPDVPTSVLGAAYTGYELLRQEGFANGIFYWAAAFSGLVSGVAIIYAAAMMMRRAVIKTPKWAAVVLVFSFVSLIGIGGFMAGAVLGILGGATAMSWEQTWLIRFRKNRQKQQARGGQLSAHHGSDEPADERELEMEETRLPFKPFLAPISFIVLHQPHMPYRRKTSVDGESHEGQEDS